MPEPIRVLMLIDSLGGGGAEHFVYQLCRHLAPDKVQVAVCALSLGGLYQEKIEALDIPVHVLSPRCGVSVSLRGLLPLPSMIVRLLGLLRRQRSDVVHTFLQASFAMGTPLARLARIPTVHSLMAARRQTQRWYFPLMVRYQRWVDLYLTPYPTELREAGIQRHKMKSVEITVDLTEMLSVEHDAQQVIEPFDLSDVYPVVLSVGRLYPDKGHEYAIRAWPHVLKECPHARLLIVGNGEDEPRLKALTDQLGLSNSVILTGYRSDLVTLFTRADILLRTSVNEGVNLTTIQGMAAGLPIIGFRNSAPKEIISHSNNGLLVSLGDEVALAQAVKQLSSDRDLRWRLGQQGRTGVRRYYNMADVVVFYENLYEAIGQNQPLDGVLDMSNSMELFGQHPND